MHPEKSFTPAAEHKAPKSADPTKANRSLAIALVVSTVFLLAAIAIVVWLMWPRGSGALVGGSINTDSAADTADVTKVSFAEPVLPANYAKTDQSKINTINVYFYDDATNCGITETVLPIASGKTAKDIIVSAVAAAETQGVTTTSSRAGDTYTLNDVDNKHTYVFDSVALEQAVSVQGVSFTKQNNVILYKQFGDQVASLGYACKSETWPDKKADLAKLVKTFTVKTER